MDDLLLELIPTIIVTVLFGIIWGTVTKKIIYNKGYYENWFWWGFWFGIFAVIVACTKPQVNSYGPSDFNSRTSNFYNHDGNQNDRSKKNYSINNYGSAPVGGEWQCSCGRTNAAYVSTCVCGKSKNTGVSVIQNNTSSGSGWNCYCGRTNASYVSTCSCGRNKSEIDGPAYKPKQVPMPAELNKPAGQKKEVLMDESAAVEAIKSYKELLDSGIITQEEFDAKKKQLMGI